MDVLYSVRCTDDGWDLRMSLRSLARYGRNVGRVVVAGGPFPPWLSDEAVLVPCDSPYARKQKNILHAIVSAMACGAAPGACLYSSDDHFMLRPYDLDAFPWFCRQGVHGRYLTPAEYAAHGMRMNHFRESMSATRRLLERNGLPIENVSGHFNTHLDARDLPAVRLLAPDWRESMWGYEPSTLFIACARRRDPSIRLVPCRDVKLEGPVARRDLDALPALGTGLVSCGESAECGEFRAWMEGLFPEPSRWERT